jgi:hypothetical protein
MRNFRATNEAGASRLDRAEWKASPRFIATNENAATRRHRTG